MTKIPDTTTTLNEWLASNASRIETRFRISRVNDWATGATQGIALDLEGTYVVGRVTVWPEDASSEPWPFADAAAILTANETTLFEWSFQKFSVALLDKWLTELERQQP